MTMTEIYMLAGFMLAAYSIVANDAIQTLGTFLASNSKRPWWLLWIFACVILLAVLVYGWVINHGDPAYGRLQKFPAPEGGITWLHVIPPFVILLLTRWGVPVSTTFLILSVFAPGNMGRMLMKSTMGYMVAFVVAILLYRFVIKRTTAYFNKTVNAPIPGYWVALQWMSTAFLWSQWLIQDLANIFVYLPRTLEPVYFMLAIILLLGLHAIIFYRHGGAIQKIVTSKTGTTDIRAATIIDFIYGTILLVFKQWSNMPMSTTWVFLGLLAGREFAISLHLYKPPINETAKIVAVDAAKAFTGLMVSIALAFGLPWFHAWLTG